MKSIFKPIGILIAGLACVAMAWVAVNQHTSAQFAASRQPEVVQYSFPVYPSLSKLLSDGAVPIQHRMVILTGWTTEHDGNGGFLVWDGLSTAVTNATWIFAVPGLTNSSGDRIGRWFGMNTNTVAP